MACSNSDWKTSYSILKKNHDTAYRMLDEAIRLEEEGKGELAVSKYEEGLILMDKALSTTIECPSSADITWEKACLMIQKMKKTRKEVLCRIAETQVRPQDLDLVPPPSYEEAMAASSMPSSNSASCASSPVKRFSLPAVCALTEDAGVMENRMDSLPRSGHPMTYSQLGAALTYLNVEPERSHSVEVIYSFENVRIYFILPDGTVGAPSTPDTLRVLRLLEDGCGDMPQLYLQVRSWVYPLVPNVSPCFRTDYGAFILPDINSPIEGAAVGLILPAEADVSVYSLLEDALHGVVTRQPLVPPRSRARREGRYGGPISKGLISGAHYISDGLVRGANRASQLLDSSVPKLKERLRPEAEPRQVSPKLIRGTKMARSVTETAVTATGYVAGKVGGATLALGRFLAPHIQRQGTRLLTSAGGLSPGEANERVGGVLLVAAGAVEGFSTVYAGLEQSATILGTSLTNNTVQIVQHKYGTPMGEMAGDALYSVGNMLTATNNIRNLTPKGLAKTTAKQTGKGIVDEFCSDLRDQSEGHKK